MTVSKGPEAFRTISEVAEELDLPQHVLRFWETRFTQIRPMKRGGGRRYYRPDDIDLLRGIRYLLYGEGYTIRGVQRILREQGPRFVTGTVRGDAMAPPDDDGDDAPEEMVVAAPLTEIDGDGDQGGEDGNGHIEPTFDPREFRSHAATPRAQANGSIYAKPGASGLSDADVRRLHSALSDLLELKRLLDQAR